MKHSKRERGQSLVELSVSLLVLLYLLSGAVEFGLAFFQYVQLRDAAQEGALYASMNACSGETAIETRVRGASASPIDLADPSVTIDIAATAAGGGALGNITDAREGDAVTVTVSYDHTVFMPFMSKFIGSTITLNGTVTDTVLTPPVGTGTCGP